MCEYMPQIIILACSLLSFLLKLIEKGENQSLPCARSDERLPDMYNRSTQMFLLAPYLQFCIALEGGADLGGFGEMRGRVCFELDLDMQAPDELFPGASNCC